MADSWHAIAARKQQERTSRTPREWLLKEPPFTYGPNAIDIPRRCGLLTEHELSITENHDATSLLVELSKGTFTSEQIVTAFSKRAAIAQQVCNCLTEIFFEDAIARAKELDAYLKKNGRPIGPLHGLPISLKDGFKVRGYDASVGVAGLCFKPAATNSALVDLLLSLGAVLYCKTNVPLTMASVIGRLS